MAERFGSPPGLKKPPQDAGYPYGARGGFSPAAMAGYPFMAQPPPLDRWYCGAPPVPSPMDAGLYHWDMYQQFCKTLDNRPEADKDDFLRQMGTALHFKQEMENLVAEVKRLTEENKRLKEELAQVTKGQVLAASATTGGGVPLYAKSIEDEAMKVSFGPAPPTASAASTAFWEGPPTSSQRTEMSDCGGVADALLESSSARAFLQGAIPTNPKPVGEVSSIVPSFASTTASTVAPGQKPPTSSQTSMQSTTMEERGKMKWVNLDDFGVQDLGDGKKLISWPVPKTKLSQKDRSFASPGRFNMKLGKSKHDVVLQLELLPHDRSKPGECKFSNSNGHCTVEIKCDSDTTSGDASLRARFRFCLAKNPEEVCFEGEPIVHDFKLFPKARSGAVFNALKYISEDRLPNCFFVCVEIEEVDDAGDA